MPKITAFFHGILQNDKIILKATDNKDLYTIKKIFASKEQREFRSKKEILLLCSIDAKYQHRSISQRNAVFKLVSVIFEAENGRAPTDEEKMRTYYNLLELYADKIPNPYMPSVLRPVHISEANTVEGARFIDGLLYHLATLCNFHMDLQADVREVLYQFEIWRGKQKEDIFENMDLQRWKEHAVYSEASGRTDNLETAHIVSRGSDARDEDKAWNVLRLTQDEHRFMHNYGWKAFVKKYPHLKGRIERAYERAEKLNKLEGFNE